MEKVLKVLKNRWFLLGISFLSFIYVLFVGYIVRLTFTCYLEVKNFTSLMALYLLINFLFAVLMFFTRKQIPTIICGIIVPLEVFALLITAFGQWYIIIPPMVVGMFIFLLCGVGESCKTVLGTLFLLMYVVGGLVYSVFLNFGITLFYVVTDLEGNGAEIDMSQRSSDYLMSEDGTYRLVKYVEDDDDHSVTSYYVELASEDEEFPFVYCYRVYGCRHVLSTLYNRDINPRWLSDDVLFIDGRRREMDEVFAEKTVDVDGEDTDEDEDDKDKDDKKNTESTKDTESGENTEDTGNAGETENGEDDDIEGTSE